MELETLSKVDVCARLGAIDPRTLDRMIADGEFPAGFPAGRGMGLRWYARDVDAYLWMQMRLRTGQRPPKRKRKPGGQPARETPPE